MGKVAVESRITSSLERVKSVQADVVAGPGTTMLALPQRWGD